MATKPAFRSAFKKRRCLLLADGYYEWLREGKNKLPYLYEIDGGKPFAMAGLWEWWPGPKGEETTPIESCTIITTDENNLASKIHDRMPVILDPDDYDTWLDPANDNSAKLEKLLKPFRVKGMTARAALPKKPDRPTTYCDSNLRPPQQVVVARDLLGKARRAL